MAHRGRPAPCAIPLLAAGLLALGTARAAAPDPVLNGLRACAGQHDSARRLDCYDRLARTVTGTPAGAPPPSRVDRPASEERGTPGERPSAAGQAAATLSEGRQAAAPSADPGVAEFGTRGGPLAEHRESRSPRQITAVVQRIGHRSYGQLVITLDNGQIWLQNEASDYFPLKEGDSVVIRKAALGSFLLFAPFKRSTRVTRIR